MEQSTLQEFESAGLQCPKCEYTTDTLQGLGTHWRHNHDGIPTWKRTVCEQCDETFSRSPGDKTDSDNEFCSQDCYHAWNKETGALSGENNPLYKERLEKVCESCGESYTVYPVHSESRFCSAPCRHEWLRTRTGPEHPLWEGGVNWYRSIRSALGPAGWKTLRKQNLVNECELCGSHESPGDRGLSLHHIVPVLYGGTNSPDNFMTLCEPCHSKVESYIKEKLPCGAVLVE